MAHMITGKEAERAMAAVAEDAFSSTAKLVPVYFDARPLMAEALSAEDVNHARLDRDAFGRVFPEIKLAVAEQILRSIATEQIGASSAVKALAEAYFEAVK